MLALPASVISLPPPRGLKSGQGSMESRRGSKRYVALAALALGLFRAAAPRPRRSSPSIRSGPGMKGYGLTVVRGHGVERFDVEVIGVLRNVAVGRSVILVSLSGLDLARDGVVAGMSGSPVYLDGKLAGAVASGWGFSKKAVAGVTPIESMASIVPERPGSPDPAAPPGRRSQTARHSSLAWRAVPEEARLEELRRALLESLPAAPALPAGGSTLLSFQGVGLPRVHAGRVSRAALPSRGERGEPRTPGSLARGRSGRHRVDRSAATLAPGRRRDGLPGSGRPSARRDRNGDGGLPGRPLRRVRASVPRGGGAGASRRAGRGRHGRLEPLSSRSSSPTEASRATG